MGLPERLKKTLRPIKARLIRAKAATAAAVTPKPAPRRPVLGIVGFFGHGNYGDELFLSVFEEYFGAEFDLVVIPDLPTKPHFSRPVEEKVAEVDAILIGGGDLIRPWSLDERYFNLAYLEKPVFMVGLGVPIRSGSEDKPHITKRYARFFKHPSVKFVGVRDEDSREWVESNIAPTAPLVSEPDIVCALTLPVVSKKVDGPKVLGIVTRLRPGRETPDDYSRLEELATELQDRGWLIRHLMLGTGRVGKRDVENSGNLDVPGKELVVSEDLDVLSRAIGECTALVSMKFHGTVVATMYGIPSIVAIPTSKNRSFMRRLGREDLLAKFDAVDLLDRFTPEPAPLDLAAVARLRTQATSLMTDLRARVKAELR